MSDLTLEQAACLLSSAAAYVGNDSGITHLAAALCRTLAVFGPTDPRHWQPLGEHVSFCRSDLSGGAAWPKPQQVMNRLVEKVFSNPSDMWASRIQKAQVAIDRAEAEARCRHDESIEG